MPCVVLSDHFATIVKGTKIAGAAPVAAGDPELQAEQDYPTQVLALRAHLQQALPLVENTDERLDVVPRDI